jgi:hypothetical protein
VFLAVMRWIKHDPAERAPLLPGLLVKVEYSILETGKSRLTFVTRSVSNTSGTIQCE